MSEMIERVAQAICGDDNPANILTVHRMRARAAIEAMREPTKRMLDAGNSETTDGRGADESWPAMIDAALK